MSEQEKFQAELSEQIRKWQVQIKGGFRPVQPLVQEIAAKPEPDEVKEKPCAKADCGGNCPDCEKSTKLGVIVSKLNVLTDEKASLSNSLHDFAPEDNTGRAKCIAMIDDVTSEISTLLTEREAIHRGEVTVKPEKTDSVIAESETESLSATEVRRILNLRSQLSKLKSKLESNPSDSDIAKKLLDAQAELDILEAKNKK